jgi:hypothetical protein
MGATMEATLVLEALNRALAQRQIEPDQLLVHTDQGGAVPSYRLQVASGEPLDPLQHVGQALLLGQRRGREFLLDPLTRAGSR